MELDIASILSAVAAARPEHDALIHRDRRLSWCDLDERTSRLAMVLHDAGLGPVVARDGSADGSSARNDHVALFMLNGNEYLESMIGAWKARAASVNVNYRYVADELRYLLQDSGARAVIVHGRFAAALDEVLPSLASPPTLILQVDDDSGSALISGAVDYEAALAAASPLLPASLTGSWTGDDTYVCYTGGTTGMPKATLWRQADFLVAALGVRRSDGSDHPDMASVLERAKGSVRALPAPPLMHGAAHWNALSCLVAGGTVIIQDDTTRFDPVDVLDAIERHGATSLLLVGDPMARPLADALRDGTVRDLSCLRHVLSGGAVLSPQLKAELLELLPGVTVVDVLGSTESGRQGVSQVRSGGDTAVRFSPSSSAVVLSDDLSRVLEPGDDELGWLAQSGRVPLGYLGDADKTAATFPVVEGVRRAVPGDRARLRSDGSIELHGRDSVCINTGGEKVFAEEVETAIKSHPGVLDAVVCGRESQRWGHEVVAVVQLRRGVTVSDAELIDHSGAHLARFKLPRQIVRRDEIVRSPSGKADYRWARDQVHAADQISP